MISSPGIRLLTQLSGRLLQDGISINLNRLLQRGSLVREGRTIGARIQWTSNVWGLVGTGTMSADMTGEQSGWFSIRMNGGADQHIHLDGQRKYHCLPPK
jgi:hypothetical protein